MLLYANEKIVGTVYNNNIDNNNNYFYCLFPCRFACVVCKHCPVFDTVAMLSIHRQGKKHLASKLFYDPNEQTLVRDSSILSAAKWSV